MHAEEYFYSRMSTNSRVYNNRVDPELEHKSRKFYLKHSDNITQIANEPSVAFYRIQEHVHSSLPELVVDKRSVEDIKKKVELASFDTECAITAVKTIERSGKNILSIHDMIKNSMFSLQQIDSKRLNAFRTE